MKSSLPILALCGIALVPSCAPDSPAQSMPKLLVKLDKAKEDAVALRGLLTEVRREADQWKKAKDAAAADILASNQALQSTEAEIAKCRQAMSVPNDPNRLRLEQLAVGAKHPQLNVGGQLYHNVEIRGFDGEKVSLLHSGGSARHAVPDYIMADFKASPDKREFASANPAPRPLYLRPLPPPPKAPSRPARQSKPKISAWQSYAKSRGWPEWFVPVGWRMEGGSMSPLKKTMPH